MICKECGKTKCDNDYFKMQNGNYDTICKDCIANDLNIIDFCKRYDILLSIEEFSRLVKIKSKTDNSSPLLRRVYGAYYATMKLFGYKDFRFKDSERFNSFFLDKID